MWSRRQLSETLGASAVAAGLAHVYSERYSGVAVVPFRRRLPIRRSTYL